MKLLIGFALTIVLLFFIMHLIINAVKQKKILPLILVIFIISIYIGCIMESFFFNFM